MSSILTIEQLITPLTPKQCKTKMYEVLAALQVSTTSWKPGGVTRLTIAVFAIIAAALSITISLLARSAFLTLSTGAWLTLVARHVFGTERFPATQAIGMMRLVNSQGGSFSKNVGQVTIAGPTGKTYRNTAVFTLGANSAVNVPFASDELGIGANAGIGTLTTLVTTMVGVTVTNTTAFVGRNEESDDALITRALLKPQSLSPNGARGAYQWFALNARRASDGQLIGVNRVSVSHSSGTNTTTVTVATPAGALTGVVGDPNSDLGAVYANIASNCVPGGVTLNVVTATNLAINVQFWAYFDTVSVGATEQSRVGLLALTPYLTSTDMPIGGVVIPTVLANKVPRDTIRDVISQGFVDAGYPRPRLVVVTSPTADVSVGTTQVPVPGTITAVQP